MDASIQSWTNFYQNYNIETDNNLPFHNSTKLEIYNLTN